MGTKLPASPIIPHMPSASARMHCTVICSVRTNVGRGEGNTSNKQRSLRSNKVAQPGADSSAAEAWLGRWRVDGGAADLKRRVLEGLLHSLEVGAICQGGAMDTREQSLANARDVAGAAGAAGVVAGALTLDGADGGVYHEHARANDRRLVEQPHRKRAGRLTGDARSAGVLT